MRIGELAQASGTTTKTLRYYEQAGLIRAVGRTQAGHRLYSPADLDWLQFVMRLKATGMPIATGPRCPAAFAKAKMIGTRMMKATSKKIGIATRPEAISSGTNRTSHQP